MNAQLVDRLRFLHKTLTVLYVFTLPIYSAISIKILFVLILVSIPLAWKRLIDKNLLKQYKYPLIFIAAIAIGLVYSTDWSGTLSFAAEKAGLSLAFLAIAIPVTGRADLRRLLLTFALGTATAGIICLSKAIYRDYTEGAYWAYHHLDFTHILGMHPQYMAYYVNFSIIIVVYYLVDHTRRTISSRNIAALLLICFYVLMHIFLAARVPLVALVVTLCGWAIIKNVGIIRYWKLFVVIGLLAAGTVYLFGSRTSILTRFNDLFVPQQQIADTTLGGYLERFMLWHAAIDANTNMIFGVGHGDAQPILTEYYRTHNFDATYIDENYNSHSQYLQIYLGSGLVGVAALICMMLAPIMRSVKENDFIAFIFFSGFVLYFLTEVILARYQGAAFYFCFYALLYPSLITRK